MYFVSVSFNEFTINISIKLILKPRAIYKHKYKLMKPKCCNFLLSVCVTQEVSIENKYKVYLNVKLMNVINFKRPQSFHEYLNYSMNY